MKSLIQRAIKRAQKISNDILEGKDTNFLKKLMKLKENFVI